MPPKKKTFVKKKKKRVTKKEPQKTSEIIKNPPDPVKPDYMPPPTMLREKLLAFLQDWKAEQQEVTGGKLSDKIHQELTPQDIRDLRLVFDATDTIKTGKVSFSDFLQIVIEGQGDSRDTYEEIKQGFSLFDCDGDGKITFDNLKDACKSAGVYFSHQDLREMIREVDTNGDGTVDMEEFINLMLQTNLF
ncbi:uncharacterized protein [Heterodontus francisci]|uniref:uncharacterized protein isoform X2 n=1 Tax=Heterodontus francisci TaxID=7792 RepID=UPI00355AFBC2